MTTQTAEEEQREQILEGERCKRNFLHFLGYVYILEPPPGGAVIKFELWPHLLKAIKLFFTYRLILILKSRQIGISWLLAAYALWKAMFWKGSVVLMLSKGEVEATDLLGKAKFIYSQLPDFLRITANPNHTTEIGFPVMFSKVRALPATKDAGRSETASLVIPDEFDFHPYAGANYAALKPTIDAGGQFIGVSTADKSKRNTTFKDLYRQARAGKNNFVARFLPWWVRPGRDQAWYEAQKREYALSDNPELLEQEYPNTEEEALSPSQVLAAFNLAVLEQMQKDCIEPIRIDGVIRIYREYEVGKVYAAGTDSSHGVGRDDAVTVVINPQTGYVVADIMSAVIPPEALAFESVKLLRQYNSPLWGIEDNDWGRLVVSKALELGYDNIFYSDWFKEGKKDSEKKMSPGWHTNQSSRWILWGEVIEAVAARLIVVPDKDGLAQFYTVIRNPDKQGRIEGMEGTHDDYPLAVGIAWQMRKYAGSVTTELPVWRF